MIESGIKTDLEDFAITGFLSDYTEESVRRFRQSFGEWVRLFEEFNNLAILALNRCQITDGDAISMLALSTFSRAVVTFEGSFILATRGLDCDSKILQRSLTEDSFLIAACARNREVATKFIFANQEERRKAINDLLEVEGGTTNLLPAEIAHLRKEQELLEAQKSAKTLSTMSYGELAYAGGSEPLFKLHYRYLSLFTHPSPSGMAEDLVYKEGKIVGVRTGPDYHDAHGNLSTATFLILRILTDIEEIFRLGVGSTIQSLDAKRTQLNATWFPPRK